jgi:hypothetical protein
MTVDPDALAASRDGLHALAEHVLAADLYRRNGRIGLRPTAGGFGTPEVDDAGSRRRVRVDGTDLVVEHGSDVRRAPLTTLRAAGELVGIDPGGPAEVYELVTPCDLDAPLRIDPRAAALLADWYALTADVLDQLVAARPHDDATAAQLWPEHLDLAISADECNYGGSPGDEGHALPYLYAGPWRPPSGEGWNESFGASLTWREDLTVDEAVAFLVDRHDAWEAVRLAG